MNRREFLRLSGGFATGLLCPRLFAESAEGAEPKPRRPNFVFILSDDQGWNGLSVQMHDAVPDSKSDLCRTPNLEKLAAQGLRFSAAYSPSPVCSPTRYSLLTGKSPAQLGSTRAGPVMTAADGYKLIPPTIERQISSRETTIAETLKRAGYATAHFGKWHLYGGGPARHGFDVSDGETDNRDAEPLKDPNPVDIFGITERAKAFMEEQVEAGRPFYLQLSHHALHYPENSLKETQKAYRERRPLAPQRQVERAAMTENLDTGVGLVMDKISRLGIADNTYVIYMSDNGSGGRGRRGPLAGGKGSLWEGGIRVPLIIRGPGVKSGACCHERVVGFDFFPTLCELAGLKGPLPDGVEGGSIVPLLSEGKDAVKRPREELVFHFPHYQGKDGPHSAILLGRYKLIKFYETGEARLFDLSSDLGETRNLARQMPEESKRSLRRLEVYLEAIGAQMPDTNPDHDPGKPPADWRGRERRKPGKGRDRRRGGGS